MATARRIDIDPSDEQLSRRKHRSRLERRQVVEETLQPGASVALIARAHGVNANQVFHWRKLYREGLLDVEPPSTDLLPIRISEPRDDAPPAGETKGVTAVVGTIHIELGNARVRIEGAVDPISIRATLAALENLRR
jgi:transposase